MISEAKLTGKVKDFLPSTKGFFFSNNFESYTYSGLFNADKGVCGGMVFTVKDYQLAKQSPPNYMQAPTKETDQKLLDHIVTRQFDSVAQFSGLNYFFPQVPNYEKIVKTYDVVKKEIDQNELSILGLVRAKNWKDITQNHQVAIFGYQENSATKEVVLSVYDPVFPKVDNITISFNLNKIKPESFENDQTPIKSNLVNSPSIFKYLTPKVHYTRIPPVAVQAN